MKMRFVWDPVKAVSNLKKHGVSFTEATVVFADPRALFEADRVEETELRWRAIGTVGDQVIAHTTNERDNIEVIRIISARRADRKERRRYEETNG